MSKLFTEKTSLPKFISVIFIIQFFFFLFYLGENKNDKSILYFSTGILLIGVFLMLSGLHIKINPNFIEYKFIPFSSNKILWDNISQIEVKKLSAISDFSGWGIRYSKKFGWGYVTNSEYGIFITKLDGKKVTLSIKEKDELINFLNNNSLHKYLK